MRLLSLAARDIVSRTSMRLKTHLEWPMWSPESCHRRKCRPADGSIFGRGVPEAEHSAPVPKGPKSGSWRFQPFGSCPASCVVLLRATTGHVHQAWRLARTLQSLNDAELGLYLDHVSVSRSCDCEDFPPVHWKTVWKYNPAARAIIDAPTIVLPDRY